MTTGTMHIDAFGHDLVQSRNKISFFISLCIFLSSQNKDNQRLLAMAFYSHSKVAFLSVSYRLSNILFRQNIKVIAEFVTVQNLVKMHLCMCGFFSAN